MNDDEHMAAERRAIAIVRLVSHREVEQAVLEAHAAGLTPTQIAYHCGRTRQWVHGILRKPANAQRGPTDAEPGGPLVDLPEDFLDHGPRPKGQVGWRCRYCGKGRIFLGTVREEAVEARTHEALCPLPAISHLGDWTIDTGDDGETTVTGPAALRFTKRDGQRIYHYEVIQWLRHNYDIARSGGAVDLTTGTFRTDTEEDAR